MGSQSRESDLWTRKRHRPSLAKLWLMSATRQLLLLLLLVAVGCRGGAGLDRDASPAKSEAAASSFAASAPLVKGQAGDCPAGMIQIPGGSYLLGKTVDLPYWQKDRQVRPPGSFWIRPNPARPVEVASFCIDRFEYPNREGERPRSMVAWSEAVDLCVAQGKRLPTQLEWQAAAQGKEGWQYSYGNEKDPSRCNTERDPRAEGGMIPAVSGAYPRCHSPLGVYDLNGNVSEWVQDLWEGPWFENKVWGGPEAQPRMLMGGTMWTGYVYGQSSLSRHRHPPEDRWEDDGFRCAKTL